MAQVVIIGGGISGLALAYRLQERQPRLEITVLESSDRLGGVVRTDVADGFVVEHGPNGFLDGQPSTWQLAQDVGLGNELVAGSAAARKNRYLFLDQRLRRLPSSVASFFTSDLLTLGGKLRMLREPFVGRSAGGPESVAAFARRRFGPQAADVFIDALVTGIHGGDPDLLDVRAAFPRMTRMEREFGSVVRAMLRRNRPKTAPQQMWSCRGGLGQLIDAVAAKLHRRPVLNAAVRRIVRRDSGWSVNGEGKDRWAADAVVLTCPAPAQAEILADVDAALATEIAGIAYNRVAVVALGYRAADVPRPYDGFGFIAPQRTRRDLLGVQWCSAIYPGRAPAGMVLWRALCGGWHRGDVVDWPDEQLVAAVRRDLQLAHGITEPPAFVEIVRWPRAIPQYLLGHPERLARIDQHLACHSGLYLAGNAYRGVALNDCTAEAGRLAEVISKIALVQ